MYFQMSTQLVTCTKCKHEFGADLFLQSIMSSGKNYKEWQKQGSLLDCPYCDHISILMQDVTKDPVHIYYRELDSVETALIKSKNYFKIALQKLRNFVKFV